MLSTYTEQTGSATASWVTARISDTHRMLQCVRADMESTRPAQRHGFNNWPHLIVGFDRYRAVSFRVVDCGDPEVTSSNLESQCEVISQAVIRELIEPTSNIAPGHGDGSRKTCPIPDVCRRHSSDRSILDNAEELPAIVCVWTCMITIGLPGINDETNHTILLFWTKSSKGTSSCTKAQNLQVGKFVKKFNTLTRVSAQRGISIRRDGTFRLFEMQQLSRTTNHTARVTKYLGEGGADQLNRIFRQNPTFSDPQLVEVVVREMLTLQSIQILATQKLSQGFLLGEPHRLRSKANDLGTDTTRNRRL